MLAPGTRIDDRYEIIGVLGSGGMSHVYRARRLHLGDEVALKVMQSRIDPPPDLRERFLRESRACAQLRHPNVVVILDFGFDSSNQPYLVMELLSGPSLREEIEVDAPMSAGRVAGILSQVASALQLAHDRGITHRDLKPANIVAHRYESGERVYKVIDFGLVSMKRGDETRLTQPAVFLGTFAYAAPEQRRGEDVTAAADVYALGVIAGEMLTGSRPKDPANRETVRDQSPPDDVGQAVAKALDENPAGRWASPTEFAKALEKAAGREAPSAAGANESLLGRYELGPVLGRGRLGSVIYRGTHRALGTPVAIRILKRDDQPHWNAVRARFLLEARTLQVGHPGLLQVRDFGEDDRHVFLTTELIEGPSLRQALSEGLLAWPRASVLLDQALDAIAALHRNGGFIAGVNPDMIRVRRGGSLDPPVPDHILISTAGIRSVQDVLATLREQELRGEEANERELPYVAPEILMGGAPDVRGDMFTIGVLAYEMVTGRLPFRAASLPELIGQMLRAAPPPIEGSVPVPAATAILRCLDPDPQRRPETAESCRALLIAR